MIDSYAFGQMVVDGRHFATDLVIFPNGCIRDRWRRREGHALCAPDLDDLVEADPEVLIAGTGAHGMVTPGEDVVDVLARRGIDFLALPTAEAVAHYNRLCGQRRVAACFHLTC